MTKNEAMECSMPLLNGGTCSQRPIDGFPCCWNHINGWTSLDFGNLQKFIESKIFLGKRAYEYDGIIHILLHKKHGPTEASKRQKKFRGVQDLRIRASIAPIIADMFYDNGYVVVSEMILVSMQRINMSRIRLESKDSNLEIIVGWDNPLISFYISVCNIPEDPDEDPEYLEFKDRWRKPDVIERIKKYAKDTDRTRAVVNAMMAGIDPVKVVRSELNCEDVEL